MIRDALRVFIASCRFAFVLILISVVVTSNVSAASEPQITAQYAVVVDADTGSILYDKSKDTPTAPASLTKIFTAIYALEAAPLDRKLTVDQSDLVGESSMGLRAGETVSLKTALYGMLLPSGNDAAMTIAQNLGAEPGDTPQQSVERYVGWVNEMAARLGLSNTHLLNPHGLDQPGHETTARDIAAITMYALKNPEFRRIIATPYYTGDGHEMYQVNRLLGNYQGLIGGKTGITDNAGFCLVEVAERSGHTIIAVVMHSTDAAWYQDATTLLDYGFTSLGSGQPISDTGRIVLSPVLVQPGTPELAATPQTTGDGAVNSAPSHLSVNQVSDNVAVVSHNLLAPDASGFSWKWPLTSLVTMLALLAVLLNYPVVIGAGSLLWRHGGPSGRLFKHRIAPAKRWPAAQSQPVRRNSTRASSRRRRTTPAPSLAPVAIAEVHQSSGLASTNSWQSDISLNAAETIGTRAVRLARRGDYHAASSEFMRALRTDSTFDLTRCSGFWGMQPAGYIAAARAYAINDRTSDAKSLLTVVKLGCSSPREIESLLHQVVSSSAG